MKTRRIYQLIFILMLFTAGAFMYACTPNGDEKEITPLSLTNDITDPCLTCEDQNLYKTVGNKTEIVGTVQICQTATDIILSYTVSQGREKAWFQISGYGVFSEKPTSLNPSPGYLLEKESNHNKVRSITYTIPIADLGEGNNTPGTTIYIASYAVVPGPDGSGGMVWAGDLLAERGNPNSRFFEYVIKECETPEPPTENCTFTQGYWFAKPSGQQWPVTEIDFGGKTYNYSQAREIFFGSNSKTGKTAAKQAFLQGLALKLSIESGADFDNATGSCTDAVDALELIEAHFASINTKVTGKNINTNTFNTAASVATLSSAASSISDCLNLNHCDNTPS